MECSIIDIRNGGGNQQTGITDNAVYNSSNITTNNDYITNDSMYWNGMDNTLANTQEALDMQESKRVTSNYYYDSAYVYRNAEKDNDLYPAEYIEQLSNKYEPVEETILDKIRSREYMKKMDTLSMMCTKNMPLTNLSQRNTILPKVRFIKLQPRYRIKYPARKIRKDKNCICLC